MDAQFICTVYERQLHNNHIFYEVKQYLQHEQKINIEQKLSNVHICILFCTRSTSYSRRRADEQHLYGGNKAEARPVAKTKAQIREEAKAANERRHPQMFGKATDRFFAAPEVEIEPIYKRAKKEEGERSRKDSIKSRIVGLRSTSEKIMYSHSAVNVSGSGMNVDFK